jgi:membrane-bound lytic murein transglycosylase A
MTRWGVVSQRLGLAFVAAWTGLSAMPGLAQPLSIPDAQLEPVSWRDLPGWAVDDHSAAFEAFRASCGEMAGRKLGLSDTRPVAVALKSICQEAIALGPARRAEAREFFETRFRPVRISKVGQADGFLTGYYEPIIEGSRFPGPAFPVPVYRQPDDLIPAIREAGMGFSNRGGAFRRGEDDKLFPYYDRGEIEDGALAGKGLEICWVKNPIDAFFMQIQGSARVRLEDGTTLRLNYAAHNGYPYTAVGAILAQRGLVPKEEMSMDRIRGFMEGDTDAAKELRRQNRSFVFFRVTSLADHQEALGAQGIPLKAGRSIAVDRKLHVYGTPFWIDAELPIKKDNSADSFRRLMIAQDTGSAIVGPARADLYFGAGDDAGRVAGRIKHSGKFVMLAPATLEIEQQSGSPPYPRPKPAQ